MARLLGRERGEILRLFGGEMQSDSTRRGEAGRTAVGYCRRCSIPLSFNLTTSAGVPKMMCRSHSSTLLRFLHLEVTPSPFFPDCVGVGEVSLAARGCEDLSQRFSWCGGTR